MTRGQRDRIMEAIRDDFRKQARAFEERFYAGEWDDDIRAGKQLGIAATCNPRDVVTLALVDDPEEVFADAESELPAV